MSARTIYWVSTGLLALILSWSAYSYFFMNTAIEGLRELGFPDFFRIQLGVLKIIAIFILLIPAIPMQIKEWAYAGVGLFFLTALVAHIAHKDSWQLSALLFAFIAVLIVSNIYYHKLN